MKNPLISESKEGELIQNIHDCDCRISAFYKTIEKIEEEKGSTSFMENKAVALAYDTCINSVRVLIIEEIDRRGEILGGMSKKLLTKHTK